MTQETRWLAWGLVPLTGLVLFWLQGMPPSVDLAAHAAQFETLKGLLQGDPLLADTYGWHVPLGYGLEYALFLPVAFIWNGAVAAKLAMALGLVLTPVATWALLRAPASHGLPGVAGGADALQHVDLVRLLALARGVSRCWRASKLTSTGALELMQDMSRRCWSWRRLTHRASRRP